YRLDPDLFERETENPLCQSSAVGCEEYKTETTGQRYQTYYFKEPGDRLCEYRSVSGSENGVTTVGVGWFRKKVNPSDQTEVNIPCPIEDYYDDGTKALIMAGDYDSSDGLAGDDIYRGWVGQCPDSEDQCTAFVDPTDLTQSPRGDAYYYINDDKVDRKSCTGVSRKQGCVLFNDTSSVDEDGGNLLSYNAFATYIESKNSNSDTVAGVVTDYVGPAVSCEDYERCDFMIQCLQEENDVDTCVTKITTTDARASTPGDQWYCGSTADEAEKNARCTAKEIMVKDTNTIIKVVRDRTCANWYSCRSSHDSYDPKQQEFIKICDEIGLCDKIKEEDDTEGCGHFVDQPIAQNLLSQNKPLDSNSGGVGYGDSGRGISWHNFDYSGMAIPDKAPLQFFNAYNIMGLFDIDDKELTVRRCGSSATAVSAVDKACQEDYHCPDGLGCYDTNVTTQKTCGGAITLDADGKNVAIACVDDDDCSIGFACALPSDYRMINVSNYSCDNDADCETDPLYEDFCNVDGTETCQCLNNYCVKPLAGSDWSDEVNAPAPSCRAYPEATTPVPRILAIADDSNPYKQMPKFYVPTGDSAELLPQLYDDFGCSYKSLTYLSETKYVPFGGKFNPSMPDGFCQDNLNMPCSCGSSAESTGATVYVNNNIMCTPMAGDCLSTNTSEEEPSYCLRRSSNMETLYQGWQGYCLESDLSIAKYGLSATHPCLSWYPTEMLAGLQDWTNQYDNAGFNMDNYGFINSVNYCVESELWEKREPILVRAYGRLDCDGTEEQRKIYVNKNKIIENLAEDTSGLLKENQDNPMFLAVEDDDKPADQILLDINHNGDVPLASQACKDTNVPGYCALIEQCEDDCNIRSYETADPVAIWEGLMEDCWPSDDAGDKGLYSPQAYCPMGYLAQDLYNIEQWTVTHGTNDEEDAFYFYFKCVPLDSGNSSGLLEEGTGGWFKSEGDLDLVPSGINFSQASYSDSIEEQGRMCTTFFNVATGEYSHVSTNILYHGQPRNSAKTGLSVQKNTACGADDNGLYGAMGLDLDSTFEIQNLLNAFVVLKTCQGDSAGNGELKYNNDEGEEITWTIPTDKLGVMCQDDTDCGLTKQLSGCPPMGDDPDQYRCNDQNRTMVACREAENETDLPVCVDKNDSQSLGGEDFFSMSAEGNYITELSGSFGENSELPLYGLGLDKYSLQTQLGVSLHGVCIDKASRGEIYPDPSDASVMINPVINGLPCNDNNDCSSKDIYENAVITEMKKCDNSSDDDKVGDYCYFDSDCKLGAPSVSANPNNIYGVGFLYCTEELSDPEIGSFTELGCSREHPLLSDEVKEGSFMVQSYDQSTDEYSNEYCGKKYYQYSHDICDDFNNCPPKLFTGQLPGGNATYCSIDSQQVDSYASTNTVMKYQSQKASGSDFMWNFIEDGNFVSGNEDFTEIKKRAPRIAGVEAISGGGYRASKSKFTLSYQNTSVNGSNLRINESQPRIAVRFFAWANDDQMPLRRVAVNWGDGDDNKIELGSKVNINNANSPNLSKFQNHKPHCQRQVHEPLGLCLTGTTVWDYESNKINDHGLACSSDIECLGLGTDYHCVMDASVIGDRFGDTTEACTEGYFQFNHTYTCNSSVPVCPDANSLETNCRRELDGWEYCQYRVGVQVLDNWNMCRNSSGVGEYDGEQGSEDGDCKLSSLANYEKTDRYIYVKVAD
ncbi:MAG: hypothetical protein WCT18_01175, partial [Patescibacteria group bacterium]